MLPITLLVSDGTIQATQPSVNPPKSRLPDAKITKGARPFISFWISLKRTIL